MRHTTTTRAFAKAIAIAGAGALLLTGCSSGAASAPPRGAFWCCQGTGIESLAKLGDSLYYVAAGAIYVPFFLSSVVRVEALNLVLTQHSEVPTGRHVDFEVEALDGQRIAPGAHLVLRVPKWSGEAVEVERNGRSAVVHPEDGWLRVAIEPGDRVRYTVTPTVVAESVPDNEGWVAFLHGPLLLAAELPGRAAGDWYHGGILVRMAKVEVGARSQSHVLLDPGTDLEGWKAAAPAALVRREPADGGGAPSFELPLQGGRGSLRLHPYHLANNCRYAVYLTVEVSGSAALAEASAARAADALEESRTVDSLTIFDANNAEASKGVRAHGATVGVTEGRTYREIEPGGWVSYQLLVETSHPSHLRVTCLAPLEADDALAVKMGVVPLGPDSDALPRRTLDGPELWEATYPLPLLRRDATEHAAAELQKLEFTFRCQGRSPIRIVGIVVARDGDGADSHHAGAGVRP